MTKSKKAFKINLPIYNQEIIFLFHLSDKEIRQRIKNIIPSIKTEEQFQDFLSPIPGKLNSVQARTTIYDNGGICVRYYDLVDIKTVEGLSCLSHELIHVCSYIFERIGMKHNEETEEAYAYLHGHLFREVLKKL